MSIDPGERGGMGNVRADNEANPDHLLRKTNDTVDVVH
jgi:hypothetical protein